MGSGRIELLQPRPKKPGLMSSNGLAMNVLPPSTGSSIQDSGLQKGCRALVDPPAGVLPVAVAAGVVVVAVEVVVVDVAAADVVDFNWNVLHTFYSKTRKLEA